MPEGKPERLPGRESGPEPPENLRKVKRRPYKLPIPLDVPSVRTSTQKVIRRALVRHHGSGSEMQMNFLVLGDECLENLGTRRRVVCSDAEKCEAGVRTRSVQGPFAPALFRAGRLGTSYDS